MWSCLCELEIHVYGIVGHKTVTVLSSTLYMKFKIIGNKTKKIH